MAKSRKQFEPVSSKVRFPEMEEAALERWHRIDVFHRVDALRRDAPLFVFYEGPPTANGNPGLHHVLSRVFKDVVLRYKTMRGFRPVRKAGWDTHGLPVELEVEKELGLSSKREIEEYGVEEFNRRCRESVFRYVKEWESMTERAGVWLDMANAYVTYDNSYIETGWQLFRRFWDRGLVYEGYKVTPHCPRCVTSLSSHEVALGYEEDTPDPSVYVRFRLAATQGAADGATEQSLARLGYDLKAARWEREAPSFLVWTTTPWTLTANRALAVAPREEYALVEPPADASQERLLVATSLMERVLSDGWQVLERFTGQELVGVYYEPPYRSDELAHHGHRVLPAGFVTTREGTGIVHTAPAYGADDQELGRAHGIHTLHTVDLHGVLQGPFPGAGKFVKDREGETGADTDIIKDLKQRGLLFRREVIRHTYPFCWRCGTPLLYYAKSSWYIRTTAVKDEMVAGNQGIHWYPEHIQEGRFGEWLRNNVDWAVSRERYWGTPIPIWRCQGCDATHCVGSVAELRKRATAGTRLLVDGLDLHRPYVDRVEIDCRECGGVMRRVPEVADAWYDSGAMPFAQWAYPVTLPVPGGSEVRLEDIDGLMRSPYFPADYITEAVDQTRGWFYSLLALSTLTAGRPSYQNVICLGLILDERGEKMSKSKGNVVDPWSVLNEQGADALRWYLFTAAPAGGTRRFSKGLVQESLRRFLLTLWNTYSFFVTYARLDGFDPQTHAAYWKGEVGGPALAGRPPHELDRWMLSELNELVREVTELLDGYNPTDAGRRIEEFVDGLSNWYVRRSRRRFWNPVLNTAEGSEADEDKAWAYVTLYTCLLTLCRLMAPLTPFVADELYRNLAPLGSPESVHLADYPQADPSNVDATLGRAVRLAMRIASLGRAARSKAGVKVRQPLARALVKLRQPDERELLALVESQVLDELNVKAVEVAPEETLVSIGIRPNLALLGPKYGAEVSRIAAALREADPSAVAGQVRGGTPVTLDGFTLEPDEVLVLEEERAGLATATEGGLSVAVDTALTPELEEEGLARELVHRLQSLRRSAGLDIADRIVASIDGGDERIRSVLKGHGDYICRETLSRELLHAPPAKGAYTERQEVEGIHLTLAVKKVQDTSRT